MSHIDVHTFIYGVRIGHILFTFSPYSLNIIIQNCFLSLETATADPIAYWWYSLVRSIGIANRHREIRRHKPPSPLYLDYTTSIWRHRVCGRFCTLSSDHHRMQLSADKPFVVRFVFVATAFRYNDPLIRPVIRQRSAVMSFFRPCHGQFVVAGDKQRTHLPKTAVKTWKSVVQRACVSVRKIPLLK